MCAREVGCIVPLAKTTELAHQSELKPAGGLDGPLGKEVTTINREGAKIVAIRRIHVASEQ
jgi:hypothetical protein